MIGLIGPDGVGKSTLLGIIAGVRRIQTGEVMVLGGNIADARFRNSVFARVAYLPQGLGKNLYPTLSIFENIDFFGRLFGQSREEREWRIQELLASTDLTPFRDRPAGKLSGGMKQKLGLCCSLIHDPDLLILDEPTTGVDPLARRQFWELDRPHPSSPSSYERDGRHRLHGRSRAIRLAGGDERRQGPRHWKSRRTEARHRAERRWRGHSSSFCPRSRAAATRNRRFHPGNRAAVLRLSRRTASLRDSVAFTAVDHVNFRIERGEIFGFLGSNGCGKTTTMKMLTGLLPPTEGTALLFGQQVKGGDVESRRRVGFMSQAFSLYTELTVRQNLCLHARLFDFRQKPPASVSMRCSTRFGLESTADTLAESLPLGIRQRLSLAVAVIHEPEMLILDEPTSGVDPVARDGFWELLIRLSRENGVTIFLSTHFMNEAERCDRMSMMHAGKVLAQGPPARLVAERKANNLEDAFIGYLEEAAEKSPPAPQPLPNPLRSAVPYTQAAEDAEQVQHRPRVGFRAS